MTSRARFAIVALACTVGLVGGERSHELAAAQAVETTALTIEELMAIKHPSQGTWSPDGSRVAFVWDRAGVQNLFVVDASSGPPAAPRALTRYAEDLIDSLAWRPDSKAIYFARSGDLWEVAVDGGEPRAVWTTEETESDITLSTDGTRVAFTRENDLWVRSLADGSETRLTTTTAAESAPVWSPDDQRLAFSVRVSERQSEAPAYSGAKLLFARFDRQPPDVGIVSVKGGRPSMVASPGWEGAPQWLDPSRLLLQRVTENVKTREVVVADAETGRTETLHRDVDDKWWSVTYLNPEPIPSPDGSRIAFISDRDGWDHLYVMPSRGGPPVQVTNGQYEVSRLAWSPDGTRVAFDTNEGGHPGTRHIAVATLGDDLSAAPVRPLTNGRGTNTEPRWSPDGTHLLYQHTDPRNSADLYVTASQSTTARPVRLSSSMPASIARDRLVEPEFVRHRAPDGQQVPAYLFVSSHLDRSRPHPAIVWVHGDGVTQNYDGWHVRRDYAVYYSFHQYLAQRGYVVLAVDYRGSIGYGKAWRQGHFRDLGGKDYEDVAAGVDYLRGLGYVDVSRIGIWGLSYGGFMTLQALTVTPELFKCGIDVAGVVDWRDWYKDPDGPWIKGRMGPPSQNAALYERTAPIARIDRLVRPLMVLHGTADVNVPFLESVRLIDVATKLEKNVEFMMYPGEFHYFHREHVLKDAWQRVERFFDQHLR